MSHGAPAASGVRLRWAELPASVHAWAEGVLGSAIVGAESQQGGFSPGSADRVVTAGGVRAFVKAVSPLQNPRTPAMHRMEARVTGRLPAKVPAPRLLGTYDDGTWVAVMLEDVEGRHPETPWLAPELHAALDALESLAVEGTPAPVAELRTAAEVLADDFAGWDHLAADPPQDLDAWARANLETLRGLARHGLDALAGETLCHLDVRADNLLLRRDGSVVLVDWPWACRATSWLDSLTLLVNVELFGGHDLDMLIGRSAPLREAPADEVSAVLAGLAGYFLDVARRAPNPGLPTVRAFQRAQGDAALRWLRRRLESP